MQIPGAMRTRTAWILASTQIVLMLAHYAAEALFGQIGAYLAPDDPRLPDGAGH